MRPRFLCSSLPVGLMFGFVVFLFRPVSNQKIRNQIYFLDNEGDIVLKGPDNPGNYTLVWEWEPHSRRGKQTVVTLRVQGGGTWSKQLGNGWEKTDKNHEVDVDHRTVNLAIKKPTFKWSGLFTLTEAHPRKQILKQYEIYGIKGEWSVDGCTSSAMGTAGIYLCEYEQVQDFQPRVAQQGIPEHADSSCSESANALVHFSMWRPGLVQEYADIPRHRHRENCSRIRCLGGDSSRIKINRVWRI
ncbi:uncharacterized protein LOC116978405 [Amblyraja radiata]|uniref:uncharacterized protein LOC116978405 n=1 Tax=Amblyraja radiata TaxID=386614 RepID=UPI001404232B|nr:uncharacterized protein LOC116978405 [Amblyraja radiata]